MWRVPDSDLDILPLIPTTIHPSSNLDLGNLCCLRELRGEPFWPLAIFCVSTSPAISLHILERIPSSWADTHPLPVTIHLIQGSSTFHESIFSSTSKSKQALLDNNDCPPAAFLHAQIGNDLSSRSQNWLMKRRQIQRLAPWMRCMPVTSIKPLAIH